MKFKRTHRIFALILALAALLSMSVSAHAVNNQETLTDPIARDTNTPNMLWSWSRGVYSAPFNIVQFTNTGYYFNGNADGAIYYCITGTSIANKECSVRTHCITCGDTELTSFSFKPSDTPLHRMVTLESHANHRVYLKIVAYPGGEYWSNNDFAGTISVSASYI